MTEVDGATGRPAPTRTAHILYLLHALAPFTAWTLAVIAVVIGAINRDAVKGTWVDSHYSWLLSTFWVGIALLVVLTVIFVLSVLGIFLLWLLWFVLTVWYLYRVIKGWMRLNDGRPAPQ
jgi:uncharacterized membrane protein